MSLVDDVIAALRSGKYKQCFNRLRDENDCMCLEGVICDVVNPAGWRKTSNADFHFWQWHERKSDRYEAGTMPRSLNSRLQAELTSRAHLTEWNDVDRLSFKLAAERLEQLKKPVEVEQ